MHTSTARTAIVCSGSRKLIHQTLLQHCSGQTGKNRNKETLPFLAATAAQTAATAAAAG